MSDQSVHSNAPEGYPKLSESGYALFYPIGSDGKPAGKPRLVYDKQTFEDEKEIDLYKRVMSRRGEPQFERRGTGPFKKLTNEACAWLRYVHTNRYWPKTGRDIFEDVLDAPMVEIARYKQIGDILNPGSNERPMDDIALINYVADLEVKHAKGQ